jgi:hypothetical protein
MSILNFIKIRWQITEILGSKVLAETPCITSRDETNYCSKRINKMMPLVSAQIRKDKIFQCEKNLNYQK